MIARYPWSPDNGDGTYTNPVLHADYSDPDAIRVGEDYWMTASSFHCAPGLPILHSRDMVNWQLVNHALRQVPGPGYDKARPGCGVWAPAIRHHNGKFWIFFPQPDEGIFVTTASDPAGDWSEPWCLVEAKGWIDPCPFWDDDGTAWLVHAYAMSRSGLKERIQLRPMSPDARRLLGAGCELLHTPHHPYLEGPKIHKINGWYYLLCPGGGVQTGWQVAFRSRNIRGPYEERVVLEQGSTDVNGPHQGALVETPMGSWHFLHFQDCGPFGRIVHLQPVRWQADWPLMGEIHNGVCQPVSGGQKPVQGFGPCCPPTTDLFPEGCPGLQWQWNANPGKSWTMVGGPGVLRMSPDRLPDSNLTSYPRFLGQKFPAREFAVETLLDARNIVPGGLAGLGVVGGGFSTALGIHFRERRRVVVIASADGVETISSDDRGAVRLKADVRPDGTFTLAWAAPGEDWIPHPEVFRSREGGWIGARVGLFHGAWENEPGGSADFHGFRLLTPASPS
jgi:beta-xylosidase